MQHIKTADVYNQYSTQGVLNGYQPKAEELLPESNSPSLEAPLHPPTAACEQNAACVQIMLYFDFKR